ncbi:hypothetical protein K2173_014955 [Erythroxylum novogranatense]|uniref:ARC105/Med15 mediator subunit C-terminal domain-containing protein n=1 Tax=Erythroxylum novogranatense TaxID=1862640 RepID=A0AAV8TVY8_9ROSI|nr:hypothetical protein K2173_014955 [Erythroxylum novogranatense]
MDKDVEKVSFDENKLASSDTPGSSTTATDDSQESAKTRLLEEIYRINERLVNVGVELDSDEDAARGREGITVKCSFMPVRLTGPLELLLDTMLPLPPLRLLILDDYPESSPVIINDLVTYEREETEEISEEVKERFNRHIGALSEPICLQEMAGSWQFFITEVINEYGQKLGYPTFSSKK